MKSKSFASAAASEQSAARPRARSVTVESAAAIGSNADRPVHPLRLVLLGGFRVEVVGTRPLAGCIWQRRSAKRLTKLLATHPRHALHREQILEILWPDVELESGLNSLGKAIYAARRALEPELLARGNSAYLTLSDGMLALNTEFVEIDADHFQRLGESALRTGDVAAYEAALAAYGGELLPEDRYEDWCSERRDFLAELHIRLLLGLAHAHEERGSLNAATDRLREILQHDPIREDVHRRLMVLYAQMGMRDQAVRQFHLCEGALRRELDLEPESATTTLFTEILEDRITRQMPAPARGRSELQAPEQAHEDPAAPALVGRERTLRRLHEELARADEGEGRFILIGGEAGVGKSRLASELAAIASRHGATVFRAGRSVHADHLGYGPFAVALENYIAGKSDAERDEFARCYPALVHVLPSLGARPLRANHSDGALADDFYLVATIVRLLSDQTETGPVVLVVEDLHELPRPSLDLLQYLALLADQRRWLIVGTFRDEALEVGSALWLMLDAIAHEPVCPRVELAPLSRPECDQLVRVLLERGAVAEAALGHIYARSGGNPLFVEELVRDMRDSGELVFSGGTWQTTPAHAARVPARVRALVAGQLAPIDECVRRVLALAAASGGQLSLGELRTAAAALRPPIADHTLLDALDRALETRILVERNGGYAFRHPLVGPALYEALPTHRRDELEAAVQLSRAARH